MAHPNLGARSSLQGAWLILLFALAVNLPAYYIHAQTAQDIQKVSIDDPRPVAKAVEELVSLYGYVITYEDPRLVYEGDIQDVTTQVRNDLDHYPPGKAPKVIAPRGGTLYLTLSSPASVSTQSVASVLDQLMHIQASRGEGGHFRVTQVGDVFHVVPAEVRDRNGNWIVQNSILNVPISLPTKDRNEAEMVDEIAEAVSVKTHIKVFVVGGTGGGISNPDRPRPYHFGAENERASDVLMRALALLNDPKNGRWHPQRLTWQLFYDSSDSSYALNIASVPNRVSSTPSVISTQKTLTGSPAGASTPAVNGNANPGVNGTSNPNPLPH